MSDPQLPVLFFARPLPPDVRSNDGRHRVWFHSSARMPELPDGSIPLFLTSPPYPIGIDYGKASPRWDPTYNHGPDENGQISFPVTSYGDYERYLRAMEPIWKEMWRALEPGGYAVINVPIAHGASRYFGEQVILPVPDDITAYWQKLGAIVKARIIWKAIRGANNGKGEHSSFMGSYLQPLEGCVIRDTEYVCIFRKPKPEGWKLSDERRARWRKSRLTDEQYQSIFREVWDDIKGAPKETIGEVTHPAVMPVELARRVILGYSVVDDVVVDPFGGTGTTALAAKEAGRKSIVYEVERRYEAHLLSKVHYHDQVPEKEW